MEYNSELERMSITTRKGDQGHTSTWAGEFVPKHDPAIEACGTVDELVAALGMARSFLQDEPETGVQLMHIQRLLFRVGSMVSGVPGDGLGTLFSNEEQVLSSWCKEIELREALPNDFVLPGATQCAAVLDLARAVSRRCERRVLAVYDELPENSGPVFAWLNRLSDYLWLKARAMDNRVGGSQRRTDDRLSGDAM